MKKRVWDSGERVRWRRQRPERRTGDRFLMLACDLAAYIVFLYSVGKGGEGWWWGLDVQVYQSSMLVPGGILFALERFRQSAFLLLVSFVSFSFSS